MEDGGWRMKNGMEKQRAKDEIYVEICRSHYRAERSLSMPQGATVLSVARHPVC
jgi:hypothetical protein